jgi:hypothetical protein
MDEQEFRRTYSSLNDTPCPFEKAILSGRCGCAKARKLNIAEREAVACRSRAAQERCLEMLDTLRHNAMFALKLTSIAGSLPHGKEIKVQCGGILGLRDTLFPEHAAQPMVRDIHAVVTAAEARPGGLQALPFQEIVKSISAYQARPKAGPSRS